MKRKEISSNSEALKHLNLVQMENKLCDYVVIDLKIKVQGSRGGLGG